jgi:hypothetical protein
MNTTGKVSESWMTAIPLAVFILFVIAALGGPSSFMNTVTLWARDFVAYILNWLKYL